MKEHVKFIFIYLDKINDNKKCKVYLIGYVFDSNDILIDIYRESFVKNDLFNGWTRIAKFKQNVLKYNIDKNTCIAISDNVSKKSIFYQLFDVVHQIHKLSFRRVSLPVILTKLDSTFHLFNEDVKTIRNSSNSSIIRKFNSVYSFILENSICPWINTSFDKKINLKSKLNCRSHKICAVCMYYLAVYFYYKSR